MNIKCHYCRAVITDDQSCKTNLLVGCRWCGRSSTARGNDPHFIIGTDEDINKVKRLHYITLINDTFVNLAFASFFIICSFLAIYYGIQLVIELING